MRKRIYFDNAASTPVDPRVLEAMIPVFTETYGNASSMHDYGSQAKEILYNSRKIVAASINALPEEILFTSSGTEANNLALKGITEANRAKGNHIIISAIEHDCVLKTSKWLAEQGFDISYLPVDLNGIVRISMLEQLIRPGTIMVSIMHVNNEIGAIQPLKEIGLICHKYGILLHSDACQSYGKIPIDVSSQPIDLLTLNAHKIYGPKGAGALYVRKGIAIKPILHGGGQENGLRSSTENIPAIAGFAKAAELCLNEMNSDARRMKKMRDYFIAFLHENFDDIYINGNPDQCLSNILNFSFHGLEGEAIRLLLLLDEKGVAVSAGSACSSNDKSNNASHVLQAIGLNPFEARGAIRVSFGRFNTMNEVMYFTHILSEVVGQLNSIFS
jgi:cysteine desulfurase